MGATWARLTDRNLPANRTELYFDEHSLWDNSIKLLCCPTAVGCVVRQYDPKDLTGGPPIYSVSKTSSYSEFVPRYEIRALGLQGSNLVGVLDKEETHLRTKLGEYVCMSLWKVKYNALKITEHGRSVPCDAHSLHMVLAQQAKIDVSHNEYQDTLIHSETERWFEMFSTDLPGFEARIRDRVYPTAEAMDRLNLYWKGSRVGTAKKQGFAGAFGGRRYGRPYVGLELAPSLDVQTAHKATMAGSNATLGSHLPHLPHFGSKHVESHETLDEDRSTHKLLPVNRLRVLLLCLAWSEKTIDFPIDETENFIQAMRAHPSTPVSAKSKHFPASWNAQDLKRHLQVESSEWVNLHKWENLVPAEAAPTDPAVREDPAPADYHDMVVENMRPEDEEKDKCPPVDPNDPLFI